MKHTNHNLLENPFKKKAPSSWTKGPNTARVTGQLRVS